MHDAFIKKILMGEEGLMLDIVSKEWERAARRGATADEVALLRGALEIDSPSGGERPLAEYLCAEMARRGLRAHIDDAGNAVGEIGEDGPLVVLLGHMDTAPGRVLVRREGDLLYGRGAVDAKGPLTAFICAAARIGAR